jgi:predicted O-linked N-acetylglucosamine transferase (SPINDLY family)
MDEAVASYRRVLELKPDFVEVHNNMGNALRAIAQYSAAVASYRHAIELKPDFLEAFDALLFNLAESETVDAASLFAEHCRFGEQFEAPLRSKWPQHSNERQPERCLQVGFVSGDLYLHSIANFIEPILAHLAGQPQLVLHAYHNSTIEDAVTQRLRGYLRHWHSVAGVPDEELAQRIQNDGIDILIDLSGHTALNRLLTFARKPAPVQVSWMGYPGTTGLQAMDYYLSDRFFLPAGQFDDQFTEKIVHLPASAPFQPSEQAPPVNTLPALTNGFVTFGSFNRPSKISRSVLALWAQLLRALPDSRMLLGAMAKDGENDAMVQWFAQEGIERSRLSFHPVCAMDVYLGLHHQVDICLDTFPYNGGTTTLHALWMGVPTLNLTGSTTASRTGASILGHLGLQGFIAHDKEDFVQKGGSWAGNLAALSDVRASLRERFAQSAAGQPAVVAAGLDRALRTMWQRWCADLPAQAFEVPIES